MHRASCCFSFLLDSLELTVDLHLNVFVAFWKLKY
uniref:Uncharacterized protein n=1 Tax=Arundo donax TaxID=35708 RepID=A0A0A9FZI2_ARUDO